MGDYCSRLFQDLTNFSFLSPFLFLFIPLSSSPFPLSSSYLPRHSPFLLFFPLPSSSSLFLLPILHAITLPSSSSPFPPHILLAISPSCSYVGIDTLTDQLRRRAVKRGFEFNIMVVGGSGLGKSTLVNTLFKSNVSRKSCAGESGCICRQTDRQTHTHTHTHTRAHTQAWTLAKRHLCHCVSF